MMIEQFPTSESPEATGVPTFRQRIEMGFSLSFPGMVLSAIGEFAVALEKEKARERVVWLHAGIDETSTED